jgi:hypothetical protein
VDGTLSLASLTAAVNSSGAKHLRFPEGESSDNYYFTDPTTLNNPNPATHRVANTAWWPAGTSIADSSGHFKKGLNFDQFMSVVKATGAVPNIVLCYPCGNKATALEMAKAWVRYAMAKGYNVPYWEIGNETYYYNPNYTDDHVVTAAEYANDVIEWATALKAINPNIKIGANGLETDWFTALLTYKHPTLGKYGSQVIDFLSVHSYEIYGSTFANYQVNKNSWGNVDFAANIQKGVNAIAAAATYPGAANIRVQVTECSSMNFGSTDLNNQGSAVMTVDMLTEMLKRPQLDYAELWASHWISTWSTNSPQGSDTFSSSNGLNASGRALAALTSYLGDEVVPVSGATSTLRSFASVSSSTGALNVVLINRSSSAQSVALQVAGRSTALSAVARGMAGSPSSTTTSFNSTGTPLSSNTSTLSFSVPATSFLILTVNQPVTLDTTAPSVPSGLVASVASSSQVNLSWAAATDNKGVTGYKVYRNGALIAQVSGTSYSNAGLLASTTYSYQVSAVDAALNESAKSVVVNATTKAGTVAVNLVANPGFEAGMTSWADWGGVTALVTGASALSGTQSLQVGATGGGRGQKLTTLAASNSYVLKFTGRMSASGDQGWVGVSFRDSSGNTIGSYSFTGTVTSTVAQVFQVTMTSPSSFAYADVWVWKNNGPALLLVDDISLAPVSY